MTEHTDLPGATTQRYRRNLAILGTAQALYLCGASVDLTLTGLVGYRLAPSPALATLPAALITLAALAGTAPAAGLLARYGRRVAFPVGAGSAALGGVVSVLAVSTSNFPLFCLGTALVGGYQAVAGYFRYSAADDAPPGHRGRAIAAVLTGGVVAAVAGPFLATSGRDLLPIPYAGAYLLVTVFALVSGTLLRRLRDAPAPRAGTTEAMPAPAGTLWRVVTRPRFVVGAAGAALGYLVMALLMTAAPIAAVGHHHTVEQGAAVVQWHLVGMYLPALVSGRLVQRLRPVPVLLAGVVLCATGALTAVSGTAQMRFMASLALVGVGWNLMYVAGSALVVASYRSSERVGAQTAAETLSRLAAAVGALSAGGLLAALGWHDTALLTLAPLALAAGCAALLITRRPPDHDDLTGRLAG